MCRVARKKCNDAYHVINVRFRAELFKVQQLLVKDLSVKMATRKEQPRQQPYPLIFPYFFIIFFWGGGVEKFVGIVVGVFKYSSLLCVVYATIN